MRYVNLWVLLQASAGLAACAGSEKGPPEPPDPALAAIGPDLCIGVVGSYTNVAYASEYFKYSDGAVSFPYVMAYLGIRDNLPMTNQGLNKIMFSNGYEIWVDETIPTTIQTVLAATPNPIGVFARNVEYAWYFGDYEKQFVTLRVAALADVSFCHGDTLLAAP